MSSEAFGIAASCSWEEAVGLAVVSALYVITKIPMRLVLSGCFFGIWHHRAPSRTAPASISRLYAADSLNVMSAKELNGFATSIRSTTFALLATIREYTRIFT